MESGIYGLRNKTTNKWYVGQSVVCMKDRWNRYKLLKCDGQPKLFNALKKYGYDNFEKIVLEECEPSQQLLDEREDFWMKHYDSIDNGYNIRGAGSRGKIAEETKVKLSLANTGYQHTDEAKKKMSVSAKKRCQSEQGRKQVLSIRKLSHGTSGLKMGDSTKQKLREINLGNYLSDEVKQKISKKMLGRKYSAEHRAKISAASKIREAKKRLMKV